MDWLLSINYLRNTAEVMFGKLCCIFHFHKPLTHTSIYFSKSYQSTASLSCPSKTVHFSQFQFFLNIFLEERDKINILWMKNVRQCIGVSSIQPFSSHLLVYSSSRDEYAFSLSTIKAHSPVKPYTFYSVFGKHNYSSLSVSVMALPLSGHLIYTTANVKFCTAKKRNRPVFELTVYIRSGWKKNVPSFRMEITWRKFDGTQYRLTTIKYFQTVIKINHNELTVASILLSHSFVVECVWGCMCFSHKCNRREKKKFIHVN